MNSKTTSPSNMTFHDIPVEWALLPRRAASAGTRRRTAGSGHETLSGTSGGRSRRPVGRVLYRPFPGGDDHSSGTSVAGRLVRPTRAATRRTPAGAVCPGLPLLFGLAPGGVCPAGSVAEAAGRSYRPVSPLPAGGRARRAGGLFSVALSLGSPPPGVTRHRVSVEPGLSSPGRVSPLAGRGHPAVWPGLDWRPASPGQATMQISVFGSIPLPSRPPWRAPPFQDRRCR